MAEHGAVEIGTATGVNYADHLNSYRRFLSMTKCRVDRRDRPPRPDGTLPALTGPGPALPGTTGSTAAAVSDRIEP